MRTACRRPSCSTGSTARTRTSAVGSRISAESEEETHYQDAVRERARDFLAALVRTAIEEHAELTPAAVRSLADLLGRGGATAAGQVAERVEPSDEQGVDSTGPR
jgi:hypothetical protein